MSLAWRASLVLMLAWCSTQLLGSGRDRQTTASKAGAMKLTDKDTVLLGDFANKTGISALDGVLDAPFRTALEESPFLKIVSGNTVAQNLKELGYSASAQLTAEISRAVCQRTHCKAYISGSITHDAPAGFLIALQAVDCENGKALAQYQATAQDKTKVLDTLGDVGAKLRLELGEAPESVSKFATPLSRATSSSFDALREWSAAIRTQQHQSVLAQGSESALPLLETAVKLDPSFASALFAIGLIYRDALQESRAREYLTRAFAAREHSSVPQRFRIEGMYYSFVSVEDEQTEKTYREWIKAYPRDEKPVSNLGSFYGDICRYQEAIAQFERAREMNPGNVIPHEDLIEILTAVGEFERAKNVYREMQRLKLDDDAPHMQMYSIAFLQHDAKEMVSQAAWFEGKPELRHEILASQSDAEAYLGHLASARWLSEEAVQAALRADSKEQAAAWLLNAAWREEVFGDTSEAHKDTIRALSIAPDSREGAAQAAILFARSGDTTKANDILADLERRYPHHMMMQSYWLPTIRAQIAVMQKQYAAALRELQMTLPYDDIIPQVAPYSTLPSIVIRAEAYSASGQLEAAAKQWESILKALGFVQLSATAPIARLRLARVYANELKAGDASARKRAQDAYKDFLSLWQDADPEISVLREAKAEFANLH